MSSLAQSWPESLLAWFKTAQRDMPWRTERQPYHVWISESMLQQTQVATVIPYFNRFIATFPTVYDLANAPQQDVLKQWEGLGYYSRARNLHKAAKIITESHNGQIPNTYDVLQTLPGIGPYIAAAVASIAYEVPVPVVDGNVLRVFCRFWGIPDDIRNTKVRDILFKRLTPVVSTVQPSQFNQAIMELGALICTPTSPNCTHCPIATHCYANQHQQQETLPYKSKAKPTPHYNIAVAVIEKNGKLLIGKRKQDQMLGGLWEFPGGKQKELEPLETTVIREVKEETGLDIDIQYALKPIKHAYTHFKITLHPFYCHYQSGHARAISTDEIKWVPLNQLKKYPFPKANSRLIEQLAKEKSNLHRTKENL